jgi:hypothetical protein
METSFILLTPDGVDWVGYLPQWLNINDPTCAAEQLDYHYRHGGGWAPFLGWESMTIDGGLKYPGDPWMYPVAKAFFRKETIYVYRSSWVAIVQEDGTYEVCRMD